MMPRAPDAGIDGQLGARAEQAPLRHSAHPVRVPARVSVAGLRIDGCAEGRGPPATGTGRNTCRTRAQLRRGKEHDFATVNHEIEDGA